MYWHVLVCVHVHCLSPPYCFCNTCRLYGPLLLPVF